ncbi:MAG: hypothetical protein QMD09_15090, partial [Desulfatibacillaceae bacterium]|nr:hypothetical protein [Desulfatibacillaceae bacterium]
CKKAAQPKKSCRKNTGSAKVSAGQAERPHLPLAGVNTRQKENIILFNMFWARRFCRAAAKFVLFSKQVIKAQESHFSICARS